MEVSNHQETNFGVETKAQDRHTSKKQRRVETAFQAFQRSVLHQMETRREQAVVKKR